MIRFNVLYPRSEGARFDHDYYRDKHMPMVAGFLGSACRYYTIEKGLAGGAPGAPTPYLASCSFTCESVEALQAALGPHVKEIMADVPNYTNTEPVIWVSEVMVERQPAA
jgi:uncharacterized protein (TIGR02118 family)